MAGSDQEEPKGTKGAVAVGRTWADLLSGLPMQPIVWAVASLLGVMFLGLIGGSLIAKEPISLGILGEFGPAGQKYASATVKELKADLASWSDTPAISGNAVGKGELQPETNCPAGYYASGIRWWGAPNDIKYCVGCLLGIQVICRKLNVKQ